MTKAIRVIETGTVTNIVEMNPVHVKGIYLQNEVQPVIVLRQAREVTLTLAEGESPMSAIGQKEFMTLKCTNQNSLKSSSEKLT